MIELWFDGICEPQNPGGHGGFGMLVKRDRQTIHAEAQYIGRWPTLSNNVSEHAGAIAALRWCLAHQITEATIYGDADMIIRQLNGKWKARAGEYLPYYLEGRALRLKLPNVKLVWIPRQMNDEADELSRLSVLQSPDPLELSGRWRNVKITKFALDPTIDTSHIVLGAPHHRQQRRAAKKAMENSLFQEFMSMTEGL